MQRVHMGDRQNHVWGPRTLRKTTRDDEALQRLPMFRSMEAALSFAFLWRATVGVKVGKVGEFVAAETGSMMLSASEKRAQARSILDVIASHTSLDQQAVLDGEFGGENGERAAAIDRLEHLFADACKSRSLTRAMLMREFIRGEKHCPSQEQLAREYGVNVRTAYRLAAKIGPAVAELRESTVNKLTPAFQRRGWLPREEM